MVANEVGSGSVQLVWSAPVTAGVTSYKVEQSTDGSSWTTLTSTLTSGTQYPVSGLTNGTNYFFRVSANTAAGGGDVSIVSVSPATAPDIVTSVNVIAGDTIATLTWTAPTNSGGSPVTSFAYIYKAATASVWSAPISASMSTLATVTNLVNGTSYQFALFAVNSIGSSDSSTVVTATPYGLPRSPVGLGATGGSTSATLSWNIPASSDLGGLSGSPAYLIDYSTNGNQWTQWTTAPTISGSTMTTTITGLNNGTNYLFRVAIKNGVAVPVLTSEYVIVAATPASSSSAPA